MPYECDRCAACCKFLIIEIDPIDIAREPKLRAAKPFRAPLPDALPYDPEQEEEYLRVDPLVPGFEWGAMLAPSQDNLACPMLGQDDLCTIYPTRPTCCVYLQAGSDQCQMARESAGLEPLQPIPENSLRTH